MAKKQQQPVKRPAQQVPPRPSARRIAEQTWNALVELPPLPAGFLVFGLVAAGLGILLYLNTLGHNYTLDDFSSIKDNWVVKGGPKNIGIIFSTEYRYGTWSSPGSLYRPIPLLMFSIQWILSPENPFLGHLTNVLFYGLSGWVMWLTWRRVFAAYPPVLAAATTLLFIAHPVHTEVVGNIKSLDEILALLFSHVSLYALWRHFENGKTTWLMGAIVAYAAALFSKEGAITWTAVYFFCVWFFIEPQKRAAAFSKALMMLIPAAVFLLTRYLVLRTQGGKETYSELDNFIVAAQSSSERLASALMMCWEYLKVLVYPAQLVHDRGFPQLQPVGFSEWRAGLALVIFAGLSFWSLWAAIMRRHVLAFAWLMFLAPFSLFSNVLFQIGTSYGERLLYAPSIGLAIAIAYGLMKLFKITEKDQIFNTRPAMLGFWAFTAAIVLAYSARTILRNPAWENSYSLYETDIKTSPNSAKMNYHRSLEITRVALDEEKGIVLDSAQVRRGIESYTRAIELFPKYHDAYGSRGLAHFRLGEIDLAMADYLKCVEYRINSATVWSNMGFIYMMNNSKYYDPSKAVDAYRKAVQYDPRFIDARRNLGAVLAQQRKFQEAIAQWQEGLKYEPNNVTLLQYIGSAYRDMGQPEAAQPWLERAAKAQAMKQ